MDYREDERRYRDGDDYYGGYYGYQPARHRREDERGFWDRAGDEVRSWFGDEEASRRRARDERGWGGARAGARAPRACATTGTIATPAVSASPSARARRSATSVRRGRATWATAAR